MKPEVLAALGDHAKSFTEQANGRLHCNLTGIDLLPDADSVTAHVHSKRFKIAKVEAGLKEFGPYIAASPDYPDKLLCTLTGALINKNEDAVWKHMMGRKFQRLLNEKEAEKTAARTGASTAAVPSKAEPSKPPKPSEAEPEDELESESSSSGEEQTDEEGGFWIPPPGARRDEDREEELAEGGEDVVMGEADGAGGANGHAEEAGAANGSRKRTKTSKSKASSKRDKRPTKSVGPAENAPQKKKRRPQG